MEKKYEMPASYKWMKQLLKSYNYNTSFIIHTVYYCIKHNLSEEESKDYFRQQAEKGIKKLMNHGTYGSLNFDLTPEIRKILPNIHDELFDSQIYTKENSWLDKNNPERFEPIYRLKSENDRDIWQSWSGNLHFDYGSGNYYKNYIIDSDIHPIHIRIGWDITHQCFGKENQIEWFVKNCFEMWQLIKRLDSDKVLKYPERTVNKKLGNWVRPLTPNEKTEKEKKEAFNKLNKGERKMLMKIRKLGLSEIFKKLLL